MKRILAILIFIALTIPAKAQRFQRVLSTISELIASNPNNVDSNITVLGYSAPYDGGGGPFTWYKNDTTATDGGKVLSSTYPGAVGRYKRNFEPPTNVQWYGAKSDGVTDDTAPVNAAYAGLPVTGGSIYIPKKTRFNLVVDKNNITLIGDGAIKDFTSPVPTAYWTPANTANAVVQVSNDSGLVKGFFAKDFTMYAPNAVLGMSFVGGAFEASCTHFSIWNFTTCLKIKDGSNPVSLITFDDFQLQSAPVAGSRGIYALDAIGGSYVSALHFINGHIDGNAAASSYAFEFDSTYDNQMAHTYIDAIAEHCGFLNISGGSLPIINMSDVVLDIAGSTNSAITLGNNFAFPWNQLQGTVKTSGSFKLANGTYWPIANAEYITPLFYAPNIYSGIYFARPTNVVTGGEYIVTQNSGEMDISSAGTLAISPKSHQTTLVASHMNLDLDYGIASDGGGMLFRDSGHTTFLQGSTLGNVIVQALTTNNVVSFAISGITEAYADVNGFNVPNLTPGQFVVAGVNGILQSSGSAPSAGGTNYLFNTNQFTLVNITNVNLSSPVTLTNLINPGFYRSGVTNVTGTGAVYSFKGAGTMNFTATGNSTITIADAQTSTNVAQIGQIHFVNDGTNTLTFAGQTNGMSVKRGTLSNPPLAGDTIYMMEQNGTNIWLYVDQVFLGTELPIDPGTNVTFATNSTTKRITISSGIGSSINPTDTFVPYRTNATSFADSLLSVDGVNRMSMSYRAADQFGPTLNFLKQGRTGSATNSPSSGAQLGTIGFGAWNGTADVYYQAIQAITTNWVVGTNAMRLDFYTASGASAALAMRLDEGGRVNIPNLTPNTYVGVDGNRNLVSTNAGAGFTTGVWVTNQSGVLSGNITAGANITFTTNASGNVTIAAASGSSGARSFQAIGTGSDFNYSIGQAIYQKIAFGTSGPSFVLTNAGTYQVLLNVATYDAGTAYQDFFITNVTDHVLVPGTSQGINVSSAQVVMPILFQITTSGSNKSFELWGQTQNMTYLTAGVTAASTVLDIIALSSGSIGNQLYQGAGAPVSNPTDTTTTNFYYDTTSQITYVWNIVGAIWE